jgi:hypothetical protein
MTLANIAINQMSNIDPAQWITPANVLAAIGIIVTLVAAVAAIITVCLQLWANAQLVPLIVETTIFSAEHGRWHRCRLRIRNRAPVIIDVAEIRSVNPVGMLLAQGLGNHGELPMLNEENFSVHLSPTWVAIDAATDRWAERLVDLYILRPSSIKLGNSARPIVLQFSFVPRDNTRRTTRVNVKTNSIVWS